MAAPITVPRLGWSMEEGTFLAWLKNDGDRILAGDPLFTLESDKAAENVEALDAGVLRIPAEGPKPGDRVKVGQLIGYVAAQDEMVAATVVTRSPDRATTEVAAASTPLAPAAGPAVRRLARTLGVDLAQVAGSGPGGRIAASDLQPMASSATSTTGRRQLITPRARRIAGEMGIDLARLTGSGRNGRVRERDVRAASTTAPAGRLIPHTNVRRTIAARMVAGVTQAAPVTLTTKVDASNLVNLREQFKAASAGDAVPGYTDLIVKLTAVALKQHPLLQAQWRDDGLFVPERIDIALAVDVEAGLLVPVIRQVDRLTLRQVTIQARELIALARSGRLAAEQMRDATFTITNLGQFGVDAFTPIVHLPQCAVLGIGRIVREPVVRGDQVVPGNVMTLSLTFDHRVVDGAPAARFLHTLRQCIEKPAPWLIT